MTVGGNGTGTVSSSPAGLSCPGTCTLTVDDGATVTLTAGPTGGSTFAGWSGACSGTGACSLTVTADVAVAASFAQNVTLIVTRSGAGTGTVSSAPAGITCGADCDQIYPAGTVVTLTATADTTSTFAGWTGGGCSGTGTCAVTVDRAIVVDAAFALRPRTLTVGRSGLGGGTVTSSPAGITCGADCTEAFAAGAVVTLTATPDGTSSFAGWSGACSGTGTCTVTMDADRAVTAGFNRNPVVLTVSRTGTGTGTVTSSPAGLTCGATCMTGFAPGTTVTLTATADATSSFAGWGGACSGTATTCTFTIAAATSVTATFTLNSYPLRVTPSGTGTGVVTSSPAGLTCGATCTASFTHGTTVTLTATPTTGHSFGGWTGACTGTALTCTVTVTAATAVGARFDPPPNIAFVTSTSHTGDVNGLLGADRLCQARADAAGLPGTYRAWLSTDATSAISRLAGASGWVRPDDRPVANTPAELAAGRMFHPIRLDENGRDVGDVDVMTGTNANGTMSTASDCGDYNLADTQSVTHGRADGVSSPFSIFGSGACSTARRMYCFGIDHAATVAPTPPTSFRRAFITSASWTPGGGLASADALCTSEATAAGLPGTYRALLPTSSASAASRFNAATGTAPWARVDGVLLATTAATLFSSARWATAMTVQAGGQYMTSGNTAVWGGAASLSVAGTSASTCGGTWVATTASATAGRNGLSTLTDLFGFDASASCSSTIHKLVCLQQ